MIHFIVSPRGYRRNAAIATRNSQLDHIERVSSTHFMILIYVFSFSLIQHAGISSANRTLPL